MPVEIRQLTYFCAICDEGSLSAAAEKLFVTEQTLSASLRKLETELGAPLLERGRFGARPTPVGADVYLRSRSILQQLSDLKQHVAAQGGDGVVRFVYVTDSIIDGSPLSFTHIDDFKRRHPHLQLHAFECSNALCLKNLADRAADVALVVGDIDGARFETHFLFNGVQAVAVSAASPLARRSALTFQDLRNERILMPPETDYTLPRILEACSERGFEPEVVAAPQRLYFDYAAQGKGVAFMPENHPLALARDDLVLLPLAEAEALTVPIQLVLRKKDCHGPATLALRDFLLETWRPAAR